jgi:hypothetical protein
MQLKVTLYTPFVDEFHGGEVSFEVSGFEDAEKIGIKAGRAIRDFIRNVPLRAGNHRAQVSVSCMWEPKAERAEKPRRRKKAKGTNAAES